MERIPRGRPRSHQGERTARDRRHAHMIADAFAAASGTPVERLSHVIRQSWPRMPLPVRAAVAEAVLPIVEPLIESGAAGITDELRQTCEEAAMRGMRSRPA